MKKIKTNKGTFIFVELHIPTDTTDFWINNVGCIRYSHNQGRESSVIEPIEIGEYLDKEKYKIISTTKDITEEIAKSLVEHILYSKGFSKTEHDIKYKNYHGGHSYTYAYESLQSLIKANGLNIENNYLILKKYEI